MIWNYRHDMFYQMDKFHVYNAFGSHVVSKKRTFIKMSSNLRSENAKSHTIRRWEKLLKWKNIFSSSLRKNKKKWTLPLTLKKCRCITNQPTIAWPTNDYRPLTHQLSSYWPTNYQLATISQVITDLPNTDLRTA